MTRPPRTFFKATRTDSWFSASRINGQCRLAPTRRGWPWRPLLSQPDWSIDAECAGRRARRKFCSLIGISFQTFGESRVWIRSPYRFECFELLIVKLWGKPTCRFDIVAQLFRFDVDSTLLVTRRSNFLSPASQTTRHECFQELTRVEDGERWPMMLGMERREN